MPLLLSFLLATLGLSIWLGFQAVGAAQSHRRTAEGVLRDYAEIAVAEYSRRVQEKLDHFFRFAFDEVPRSIRRGPLPSLAGVRRDLGEALRRVGCDCESFRAGAAFFAVDLLTGDVEALPATIPEADRRRVAEMVSANWNASPGERIALLTAAPGEVSETGTALFYNASLDGSGEEGRGRAIIIIAAELAAMEELFQGWYEEELLLPEVVAGFQPNDSLLHLAVWTSDGVPVFLSPRDDPDALLARDTLPPEFGSLIVEAAVRPDAASSLVIGGLPRARLPLLLALMILTVGIGAAALVQIRREEELARLRDGFISGVSHEFRTPLTQLRMFTELLADGKLRTEEERARSIRVINREARRLTHLVENILHFSRMGRAPVLQGTTEEVVVQEAFRDLTEAFAPLAQAQECSLQIRVEPPDLLIRASRGGLHQMMANLLDNALKYGPKGQEISLEAVRKGDRVRISVEDEGPGVPPKDRTEIWDPYHRMGRDVAGEVQGSGIGLAVVAGLAAAAGGSAWAEDGKEKGARFVIELPTDGGGVRTPSSFSDPQTGG